MSRGRNTVWEPRALGEVGKCCFLLLAPRHLLPPSHLTMARDGGETGEGQKQGTNKGWKSEWNIERTLDVEKCQYLSILYQWEYPLVTAQ